MSKSSQLLCICISSRNYHAFSTKIYIKEWNLKNYANSLCQSELFNLERRWLLELFESDPKSQKTHYIAFDWYLHTNLWLNCWMMLHQHPNIRCKTLLIDYWTSIFLSMGWFQTQLIFDIFKIVSSASEHLHYAYA